MRDIRGTARPEQGMCIVSSPSNVVGPSNRASYRAFVEALKCPNYRADVAARQCAACDAAICLGCSSRCDWDGSLCDAADSATTGSYCDISRCAFALCLQCILDVGLDGPESKPSLAAVMVMETHHVPYLTRPICDACEPAQHAFRPAHVDLAVYICSGCSVAYCSRSDHTRPEARFADGPRIGICRDCYRGTCINLPTIPQCEAAAGFTLNWCSNCSITACSNCTRGFTLPCTSCGMTAGCHFH